MGGEEESLLRHPSALPSIRTPLSASPSASRHPGRERQETAETWDSQTFSQSDAVGEEEERFPAPRQADINRLESMQHLPWPRAGILPDEHKCLCKPSGTRGSAWLSPPPDPSRHHLAWRQHHPWPGVGGGITMGRWKLSSSQPGMCKPVGFPLAGAQPVPSHPEPGVPPRRAVPSPAPACVGDGADGKAFWPQGLL